MKTASAKTLDFVGPFTFSDSGNYLFDAPCASAAGVYLWTIRQRSDRSHLIHYVGETKSFARRHREHLVNILGLNYGIFDPDKAQDGVCELVWSGLWRERSPDGPLQQIKTYQSLHEIIFRYVLILNVFFAEIDAEPALRKHIEGCIGWNLRNHHPDAKALYPDDNHIGTKREKDHGELLISSSEFIRGLDERIQY